MPLREFPLWEKMWQKRRLLTLDLELTARCNLNCRIATSIGRPETAPRGARSSRASHSRDRPRGGGTRGPVVLLTGGEPLLRKDFLDIYLDLKRLGLLVSVFTNATLVSDEHVRVFKRYLRATWR